MVWLKFLRIRPPEMKLTCSQNSSPERVKKGNKRFLTAVNTLILDTQISGGAVGNWIDLAVSQRSIEHLRKF